MSAAPVDVLVERAVDALVSLASHGGTFGARRVVPEWVRPNSTGLIANRINALGERVTTAQVRRSLQAAARAGKVTMVGTGREYNRAFNKSAAAERELYWQLTDAALAKVGAP